ncbi:hypothetical protein D9757_006897 [Collybiopsis confluens]|uniref:F-box domain-containing protein n=1 Tax=Collybiopsis confluens TaxID=2823264 RepID=A0A8H5HQ71_9AGAR|nr:hypothetical protein D9757_006897 [Collybiopsis confluens]
MVLRNVETQNAGVCISCFGLVHVPHLLSAPLTALAIMTDTVSEDLCFGDADTVSAHSSFRVAIPDRRSGQRTLEVIPTEIYMEIISYVVGGGDLSNLALVCRLFSALIIPKRFEKVYVQLPSTCGIPMGIPMSDSSSAFYKALHSRHDPLAISLCVHVRECVMATIMSLDISSSIPHFENLLHMPNLRHFTLKDVYLAPDVIRQISRLSSIRSLTLLLCQVRSSPELPDDNIIEMTDSLHLESLSLNGVFVVGSGGQHYKKFAPLVANTYTTSLSADDEDFFNHLAQQQVVPPLQRLKLQSLDVSKIFDALNRFTTLVDLQLYDLKWPKNTGAEHVIKHPLSLSNLPQLRRLTCPASFAYLFSGPHTLEEISFASSVPFEEAYDEFLASNWYLRLSEGTRLFSDSPSENLQKLVELPQGFIAGRSGLGWPGKLRRWFPQLKHIDFRILLLNMRMFMGELSAFEYHEKELRDLLGKFVHAWGQVKTIQTIHFHISATTQAVSVDATWLRHLISELDIKDVFPNLRRVIFGDVEYFKADESFLRTKVKDEDDGNDDDTDDEDESDEDDESDEENNEEEVVEVGDE